MKITVEEVLLFTALAHRRGRWHTAEELHRIVLLLGEKSVRSTLQIMARRGAVEQREVQIPTTMHRAKPVGQSLYRLALAKAARDFPKFILAKMDVENPKREVTARQAAKMLNVDTDTLRVLVKQGRLRARWKNATGSGGHRLIELASIRAYLRAQRSR